MVKLPVLLEFTLRCTVYIPGWLIFLFLKVIFLFFLEFFLKVFKNVNKDSSYQSVLHFIYRQLEIYSEKYNTCKKPVGPKGKLGSVSEEGSAEKS